MGCRAGSLVTICAWLGVVSFAASPRAWAQPDVVTGYVGSCEQNGREGPVGSGTVGLGMWTTSCNPGTAAAHWFQLPDNDHPVINLNMYRLRTVGGADRFEQIGQAWLKHGFGSSNSEECGLGCLGPPIFEQLSPKCSDTYAAIQIDPCGFGTRGMMAPRSIMNPYTGVFGIGPDLGPGGGCDENFPAANHIGHAHDGISHRLQVKDVDLMPGLNPGARYFGEGQYIVPHEFRAANGNQNNNVSHTELEVFGPDIDGVFSFADASFVNISQTAVSSWPGASHSRIEPSPMNDGRAELAYKVTNLGGGTWHYELAIHNMNLDTSVASLRIPVPAGVTLSNIEFFAPPHHAPEANADNYSNAAWTVSTAGGAITWSTTPFSSDPLANAVRYGTLYNFRFRANAPPKGVYATIGLFKNGVDLMVPALGPRSVGPQDCNGNLILDSCDLSCAAPGCAVPGCGTAQDCDGTGVPDACERDCNGNGRDDGCDISLGSSSDCSANGLPDECEPDCNLNVTVDICEILAGGSDCNANGAIDSCDISSGFSQDDNGDNIPDECAGLCAASSPALAETIVNAQGNPAENLKNRYLSFTAGDPGRFQAVRIRYVNIPPPWDTYNNVTMWVTNPSPICETAGIGPGGNCPAGAPTFFLASLTCTEPDYDFWDTYGTVHVTHESIVPGGTYVLQVIDRECPLQESLFSIPTVVTNPRWGNVAGPFSMANQIWTAAEPAGNVDIVIDVISALEKFGNRPTAPRKARVDVEPRVADQKINFTDVTRILDAFRGSVYPFAPVAPPPCGP